MLLHEIKFKHGKRLVKVEQASIQTMKSWRDRGCGSEGKWEGQKVNGKKKKEIKSFIEKAHTIFGTRRIVDVSM